MNHLPDPLRMLLRRGVGRLTSNRQVARGMEGFACAAAGDFEEARKILNELLAQSNSEAGIGYYIGVIHCLLGEKEQAISWFEKAYEEKLGIIVILGGDPIIDPLRSEPRFQALLSKLDVLE